MEAAVALGEQLSKATAECYNIFSQISEAGCSQDPDVDSILHELRTEALRLREWEQGWNLGCSTATRESQRHLDPNDVKYRYALASLARIVVGFATVAELQSSYTEELTKFGKSGKSDKSKRNNTLAPIAAGRITRSRSKSPCPDTTPISSPSHNTQVSAKLAELRFWENPKSLQDPQSLLGLAKEIEVMQNVQQALPGYRKLSWVLTDNEKYQRIVCQLKKYIDGLFDVLPPLSLLSFHISYKAPNVNQDSYFVQREYFNKLLISQIEAGTATKDINQVVIYGTGGMGKTQLVLNYVSRYHQNYSSVFWINATSEETIKFAFTDIMQRLINSHAQPSGSPDYTEIGRLLGMAGKLDSAKAGAFNTQNPEDEHHVIEAVKQWLATERNTRWLLVFDNLDDLESFNLNNYIPSCQHGTILITSRRRDILASRRGFEVQQMQDSDARLLLLRSSHRELEEIPDNELEQEEEAITAITQNLGFLPLALDNAGSYIFKEQCTFRSYLKELEANISFHLDNGWKWGQESVFASWEMSFEVLRQRIPNATDLLSVCGFLDNNDISDEFLRRGMELETNDSELKESIHALLSYSFIKRTWNNTSFNIHPLVHMWAQKRLEMQRELYVGKVSEVFQIISSALAYNGNKSQADWDFERCHMPHLAAIGSHMDRACAVGVMDDMETVDCIESLGQVLTDHGRYDMALKWYQLALAGREKQLGADHSDTLTAMHNMASVLYKQGKYDMALEWYQRALVVREKQIGVDHPSTLDIVSDMASIFESQGKYDMALEWCQRALAGREKQLGVDHPSTLSTMNNMALIFYAQGKYDMALEWYQRALAGREKQIGVDHPDLEALTMMHNMALALSMQNKYDMALECYQQALVGREKQLGGDHPITLSTVHYMASVFNEQGKYDMAVEWYQRALVGRERQLGANHPHTLNTVHSMASLFRKQGKYDIALEWYQRVLAGREKQLGVDHPGTLTTVSSMASIFQDQGKYDMAVEWYQRALAGLEKQLGVDHPGTLSTVSNMASIFQDQGKYDMALEWYQRALAGQEKQLGVDHSDTWYSEQHGVVISKPREI